MKGIGSLSESSKEALLDCIRPALPPFVHVEIVGDAFELEYFPVFAEIPSATTPPRRVSRSVVEVPPQHMAQIMRRKGDRGAVEIVDWLRETVRRRACAMVEHPELFGGDPNPVIGQSRE